MTSWGQDHSAHCRRNHHATQWAWNRSAMVAARMLIVQACDHRAVTGLAVSKPWCRFVVVRLFCGLWGVVSLCPNYLAACIADDLLCSTVLQSSHIVSCRSPLWSSLDVLCCFDFLVSGAGTGTGVSLCSGILVFYLGKDVSSFSRFTAPAQCPIVLRFSGKRLSFSGFTVVNSSDANCSFHLLFTFFRRTKEKSDISNV